MSWVRSRLVAAVSASVVAAGLLPSAAGATTTGSPYSILYPYVECVSAPLSGSLWSATFGYVNTGETSRFVTRGFNNMFDPEPTIRPGQLTAFLPGVHPAAYSTSFDPEAYVSWSLFGVVDTATTAATRCEQELSAPAIAGIPAVGAQVVMAGERVQLAAPGYDVTYRWYRDCDAAEPVHVADGRSYLVQPADAGHRLQGVITYSRSVGDATVGLRTTTACGPAATAGAVPAATEAPIVSGLPKVGEPLSVTAGAWSGSTPSTELVEWEVCESTCVVAGTETTYTPDADDVGKSIRARVIRTNDFGSGDVTTPAVGPILPEAPTPPPAPAAVSLGSGRLDLGKVAVRKQGKARTVTISNSGGSPLLVHSVSVIGKHRNDIVLTTTCPGDTLAAGASCTVSLRLTPSAAGRRTASLVVTTTAGAQTVALTGKGVRTKR